MYAGGDIMGPGKSHLRVIANPEDPARLYRALMRRHRRYMRQKYLRRLGLPALAGTVSAATWWTFFVLRPAAGFNPLLIPGGQSLATGAEQSRPKCRFSPLRLDSRA